MSTKQSLSATNAPGVFDKANQAYSDSNAPGSLEMTIAAEPTAPPSGETVLWSPNGTSLMMKSSAGVITTVGPSAGGASGSELTATTDYTTTTPSAPSSTGLKFFSRHRARRLPAVVGPTGMDTVLQPALFSNRVMWMQAINGSTTPTLNGMAVATNGTIVAQTVTSTPFYAAMTKVRYTSSTTAASQASVRTSSPALFTSTTANLGGFFVVIRFGLGVVTATNRSFVGLSASSGALAGSVNPSAFTNIAGVGSDSGDTTMSFMYNATNSTATKIDLGSDFPSKVSATQFYEVRLFVPSGAGNSLYWSAHQLNNGAVVQGGPITTNLPAVGTLLSAHAYVSNGTSAAGSSLDLQSIYIETDN